MNDDMERRRRFWQVKVIGEAAKPEMYYDRDEACSVAEVYAERTGRDVFVLEAYIFVRFVPPVSPKLEAKWLSTGDRNQSKER